jgi:hypothetical protein
MSEEAAGLPLPYDKGPCPNRLTNSNVAAVGNWRMAAAAKRKTSAGMWRSSNLYLGIRPCLDIMIS